MRKHAFMHGTVSFAALRGVNPQGQCASQHDRFGPDFMHLSKNVHFLIVNITGRCSTVAFTEVWIIIHPPLFFFFFTFYSGTSLNGYGLCLLDVLKFCLMIYKSNL